MVMLKQFSSTASKDCMFPVTIMFKDGYAKKILHNLIDAIILEAIKFE